MEVAGATPIEGEGAESNGANAVSVPVSVPVPVDDTTSRTIFVGNLHRDTTNDLLIALFSQYGPVKSCKLIKDSPTSAEPFGFVEFEDRKNAELALNAMVGRAILNSKVKVNWALGSGLQPDQNGLSYATAHTIFVGDLANDMKETALRAHFSKFGTITGCRIVRDPISYKSKNYGFIGFSSRAEAEAAICEMDGAWIGTRTIRANWAMRRPYVENEYKRSNTQPDFRNSQAEIQRISHQTNPSNCTIFVGNLRGISDEKLRELFSPFGPIVNIRLLLSKGYGFVSFTSKMSAIQAILNMNQQVINGICIKVAWGKERETPQQDQQVLGQRQQWQWQWPPNSNTSGNGYGNSANCLQYMQPPPLPPQQLQLPPQQQYQSGDMNYWFQNPAQAQGYSLFQNSPTHPYYGVQFDSGLGFANQTGGTTQAPTRCVAGSGGNGRTM